MVCLLYAIKIWYISFDNRTLYENPNCSLFTNLPWFSFQAEPGKFCECSFLGFFKWNFWISKVQLSGVLLYTFTRLSLWSFYILFIILLAEFYFCCLLCILRKRLAVYQYLYFEAWPVFCNSTRWWWGHPAPAHTLSLCTLSLPPRLSNTAVVITGDAVSSGTTASTSCTAFLSHSQPFSQSGQIISSSCCIWTPPPVHNFLFFYKYKPNFLYVLVPPLPFSLFLPPILYS